MTKGGRNLVILGVLSVGISIATVGVSLMIYHKSGDIYLDRSRPGFLPDEEEEEEEPSDDYSFLETGIIDEVVIEGYLGALKDEIEALELYKPFSAEALSDEKLGI